MAAPKAFYQDLSLYTLSATSTNASYPLANLQTYFARDQWRSANTNANQALVIDFGAARYCDFLVLENHNFPSAYSSVPFILEAASDSGFTTNLVTVVEDLDTFGASVPVHQVFAAVSRRYWRINFGSAVLSAAPQLGQIFLGSAFSFGSEYEFGAKRDNRVFKTSIVEALDGSIRTAQAFAGRRKYELQFRLQSNTIIASWNTFVDVIRGALRPFYLLDVDGTTIRYVHAPDAVPVTADRYDQNSIQSLTLVTQQVS